MLEHLLKNMGLDAVLSEARVSMEALARSAQNIDARLTSIDTRLSYIENRLTLFLREEE